MDTVAIDVDNIGQLVVTTVEQMLCDKLSALFSDRRQRRIKDLYDVWHLLTTCDINVQKLILCLNRRGLYPLRSEDGPFTYDHIDVTEDAYSRVVVYNVGTERARSMPTFAELIETIGGFCAQLSDAEV